MVDKPHGQGKQKHSHDKDGESKTPILPESDTASADKNDSKKHANDSTNYKKEALRMRHEFFSWIWSILSSASFWTAAATVAIAAITFAYTFYAKRQWEEMHKANEVSVRNIKIAEQTLKDSEQQFAISHRPWCAFAELPKVESVLKFDNEGGHLEISYTIRNGGTAPAISVATIQELTVSNSPVPNPNALKERLEQLTPPNFVDTITGFGGTLLLPEATMDIPPSQVKVLKMALDQIQGNKVSLFLFLSIAYRDESKAIHKTGAVYIFIGPNGVRSFQPQGTTHGRFQRFGAGYAD